MSRFELLAGYQRTVLPGSTFTFTSQGGPLILSINLYTYSFSNQSYTCRPLLNGTWAGTLAGFVDSPDYWSEGLLANIGWSNGSGLKPCPRASTCSNSVTKAV
jgi:hypothetical protein